MVSILVFTDYYLPGYKSGGPVRSLSNMVNLLGDEFNFHVVTADRDLGDMGPYSVLEAEGSWQERDGARVLYVAPGWLSPRKLRRLLRSSDLDVIYLNSFFSPVFTIMPLFLRRLHLIPHKPIVLAPRGELISSAVETKKTKKLAYLAVAKAIGLYKDVVWQASSVYEEAAIRHWFGDDVPVMIAPDLPAPLSSMQERLPRYRKEAGRLNLLFLSRVARQKNLDGALRMLDGLKGDINFNIYGPVEDEAYWKECQVIASDLPRNIKVRYKGAVPHDQIQSVMARHDLLFLPTRGENFGHAILEALVAGCPVLISDQTPWHGLQDKGAGWDIPLRQYEQFLSVLELCVKASGETHEVWSRQARAYGLAQTLNPQTIEQSRKLFRWAVAR